MKSDITKNVYRYAMELAYDKLDEGISYNDLIAQLSKYKFNERSFALWFLGAFTFGHYNEQDNIKVDITLIDYYKRIYQYQENARNSTPQFSLNDIKFFNNEPAYLSSDSIMKLMEIKELEEARDESLKANRQARNAFRISIIALILSVVFSIIEITFDNNPKTELKNNIILDSHLVDSLYNQNRILQKQIKSVECIIQSKSKEMDSLVKTTSLIK